MKRIDSHNLEKLDALIGFVNDVAEIVSDPEEACDFNAKDCPVYAVGYSVDENVVDISTLESSEVEDFTENLDEVLDLVKSLVKADFSKDWEKLRNRG